MRSMQLGRDIMKRISEGGLNEYFLRRGLIEDSFQLTLQRRWFLLIVFFNLNYCPRGHL